MEGSNLAIINNNTIRKKDTSNNKQVSEIFKRHIETKLKLRKIKNQEYLMVLKKAKLKSDNYNDNETNITKLDLSKHFESYLKDTSNSDITSNLVNHNFNEESCIRCLTEIRNYSIYKKNTNSNILELCNQFIETPLYLFFLVQSLIDKNDSIRVSSIFNILNIFILIISNCVIIITIRRKLLGFLSTFSLSRVMILTAKYTIFFLIVII